MSTEKLQMQVQAAEIIAEYTLKGLAKYKSDLMYDLFGIRSIEEFNKIPYNTVRIVNGKVVYNEEVIKKLFTCYLNGAWDEFHQGLPGRVRLIGHMIKNLRIIKCCNKIDKESKRIYDLYISPTGDRNVFKTLSRAKDDILLQMNDTDKEDIEYYGGLEKYIQERMPLEQILSSFTEDMKPTKKLIQRLNALLK